MEDQDLLRRYRAGEVGAFEALIVRHESVLCRYVTRMTGDATLAQDVVQDTFLALIENASNGIECPKGWLFRVARNRARDLMKKEIRMRSRQVRVASQEAVLPGPSPVEQEEESCRLARELGHLPEEVVEVLCLKVLDGLSYRQISGATGHSLGKISHLVHQGLTRLSHSMNDFGAQRPAGERKLT